MSDVFLRPSDENTLSSGTSGSAAKSQGADIEPPAEALTYRVRRIPATYKSFETLAFFLYDVEPALGSPADIEVYSLANSLSPYDETKVATVVFKNKPAIFDNGKDEWTLRIRRSARERDFIIIDTHFSGFTVLNDPLEEQDKVDCFAISGLASHPFGSWRCRAVPDYMWLRDQLPRDLKRVRVILYGYDTKLVRSTSFQSIFDIARTFAVSLRATRGVSDSAVPMVFVAHSFGGLVVKSALIQLAADCSVGRDLSDSIKAILFFGTPSRGMRIAHLQAMVRGQANEALIKQLEIGSPDLENLEEQFNGISTLRNIVKISIYETMLSPTAKMDTKGQWNLSGTPDVLVDTESAIQKGTLQADRHPIDRTHSEMVKFAPDDMYYQLIRIILHDSCQTLDRISFPSKRYAVDSLDASSASLKPKEMPLSFRYVSGITSDGRISFSIKQELARDINQLLHYDKPWRRIHSSLPTVSEFLDDVVLNETEIAIGLAQNLDVKDIAEDGSFPHFMKKKYYVLLQEQMRQDLQLKDQHARLHQVQHAFAQTFEWAFTKEDLGLRRWLERGEGLYWIRGKPGSGKSTLLKYLYNNELTETTFAKSSPCQSILTSYFFHDRGSRAQKSLEGLIQSVVSQILESAPELEDMLMPEFLQNGRPKDQIWPMERLSVLMDTILLQQVLPLRVLLFLDALDEFHGDKDLLCSFLSHLTELTSCQATQICICFTSRPVQIFIDEFEQHPGLVIQEHTENDITEFLHHKLTRKRQLFKLLSSNSYAKKFPEMGIAEEIRKRAKGVFLWVSLTVEELSRAARDGTTTEQIEKILSSIPDELESFYDSILSGIDPRYRHETYAMLDIAMRQQECSAFIFDLASRFAATETHRECITILDEYTADIDTGGLFHSFERRLRSRTGGLLELVSEPDAKTSRADPSASLESVIPGASPYACKKVSFLHQTVKEYFAQADALSKFLLSAQVSRYGNGHSFLSKAALAVLIHGELRDGNSDTARISQLFKTHAYEAEQTTGLHLGHFYGSVNLNDLLTVLRSLRISDDFANSVLRSSRINDEASDHTVWIIRQSQPSRKTLAQKHIAISADLRLLYLHITGCESDKSFAAMTNDHMASNQSRESQLLLKLLIVEFCAEIDSDLPGNFDSLEYFLKLLVGTSKGKAGLAWKFVFAKAISSEPSSRSAIFDLACFMLEHGQDPNVPIWLDATALAICVVIRHPDCSRLASLLVSYGAIDLPCPLFKAEGFNEFVKASEFLQRTYDWERQDEEFSNPMSTLLKPGSSSTTPYPP